MVWACLEQLISSAGMKALMQKGPGVLKAGTSLRKEHLSEKEEETSGRSRIVLSMAPSRGHRIYNGARIPPSSSHTITSLVKAATFNHPHHV